MPDTTPSIAPPASMPTKARKARRRKSKITAPAEPAKAPRRRSRKGGKLSRRGDFMGRSGIQQKIVATGGALVGSAVLAGKTFNGIPQTVIASLALDYFAGDNPMIHDASTGMFVYGAVEWQILNAVRSGPEEVAKMLAPYVASVYNEGGAGKDKAIAIATMANIRLPSTTGDDAWTQPDGNVTGYQKKVAALADRHARGG